MAIRARVLEKDRAEPAARCVLVFALRGKGEGRRISPTRGCAASGQHTGAPVKEGAGGAADGDDEEGSKARARTPAMPHPQGDLGQVAERRRAEATASPFAVLGRVRVRFLRAMPVRQEPVDGTTSLFSSGVAAS